MSLPTVLRSCGSSSPHDCGQTAAPRLHAALGQQLSEPPDLTRRCVPLQRRHTDITLAPLVCLSHTHLLFYSREEDDANTPKGDGGSHLSRDPVFGGRLRADGPAYEATASSIGAPALRRRYYSLGE